jgi:SAM-dependent methyltransferase
MRNIVKKILKAIIPSNQRAELIKIIKKIRYYGFKYECPICNSKLRKFLPFGFNFPVLTQKKVIGGGYRPNALCPVCGSDDRERLLYLSLSIKTDVFKKRIKLLHVAPEIALSSLLKKQTNIEGVTADINSDTVMVQMDITDIHYPDGTFDAVICNHVLEHIIDDRKAMHELHRILKPGGWGILQVPLSLSLEKTYEDNSILTMSERERAFGQSDHVRIYAKDYYERLEAAGFQVNLFKWRENDREFGGSNNRFGLIQNETIVFVIKTSNVRLHTKT